MTMLLERWHVIKRAVDRGYDPHTIWPCFIRWVRDDVWEVDVNHEAYPKATRPEPKPADIGRGAGTELKKMLAAMGLRSAAGCKCDQRAKEMNDRGVEWCAANIETIVGWLAEEAAKRRLPFSKAVAGILVRRAIRNAISS